MNICKRSAKTVGRPKQFDGRLQIRIDDAIKQAFAELCAADKTDVGSAVREFIASCVAHKTVIVIGRKPNSQ